MFFYFKHEYVAPKLYDILKSKGTLLVLYMAWLPYEDRIAGESEKLILKYSPNWSGAGGQIHPISIHECYSEFFELVHHDEYYLNVHFTKETWNGRIKACRGVGASLTAKEINLWEQEHKKLLDEIAPEEFDVLHYGAMAELRVRK